MHRHKLNKFFMQNNSYFYYFWELIFTFYNISCELFCIFIEIWRHSVIEIVKFCKHENCLPIATTVTIWNICKPLSKIYIERKQFPSQFRDPGSKGKKKDPVYILERSFVPSRYCVPSLNRADSRLVALGKN